MKRSLLPVPVRGFGSRAGGVAGPVRVGRARVWRRLAPAVVAVVLAAGLPVLSSPAGAATAPVVVAAGAGPGSGGVPSAAGSAAGWVPPVWSGSSGAGGPQPAVSQLAEPVAADGELVGLRGRHTSTFRLPDGSLQTRLSTGPAHFTDGQGRWQRLETDLVPEDSGRLRVRAADYALSLPRTLAEPVVAGQGAASVSFALRGAQGARSVRGATATYAQALPGVDVAWTAQPGGVKEELILGSVAAPSSFVYDVRVPAGVRLALVGGQVQVLVGSRLVATVPAPFAFDAAGVLTRDAGYTLSGGDGSYELMLRVDAGWLQAPERA